MRSAERIRKDEPAAPPTEIPATEAGEGLVIESVEMRDFMRYLGKRPPVRFPGRFTVVTGKTGSGKTTILDAITFALYKDTTRTDPPANVKIEELCRKGGFVRVVFRQRGKTYEVRRGFDSKGKSDLQLYEDGMTLTGTIPEKERTIRDIIGLDYTGFRNSTFVRQEEMKALGAARGSDRLEVFQKLFRLETFEKAAAKASESLAATKSEVDKLTGDIQVREERVRKIPELRKQMAKLEEEIATAKKKEADLTAKLAKAEESRKALAARHDEYTRAATQAQERLARFQDLEKRFAKVTEEGAKAQELRKEIDALAAEVAGYDALREESETLKAAQQAYQLLTREREGLTKRWEDLLAQHERTLKRLSAELFKQEERIAKLTTQVSAEEAFSLLRSEGALGERIARIEKEVEWLSDRKDLMAALETERNDARTELKDVTAKTGAITQDSFVLSEIKQHIDALKRQIREEDDAHEERQRGMREEYAVLDKKVAELAFTDESKARLNALRAEVTALEAKRKTLETGRKTLEGLGDPTARLQEMGEQKAAIVKEMEAAKGTLESLAAEEAKFEAAKKDVDAVKADLDAARAQLGPKVGVRSQLATDLLDAEAEEGKLDQAKVALGDLADRHDVLTILKNEVFHKRGVVMYAINQLLPGLQIEASQILSDLTDGRFSQIKLETYEEARGHGVRILVLGVDGAWHDVGEFSGGEKTQINAALRFAIAKELASMPQVGRTYGRMKTLFLDEADLGSLDTESSRELFVQKLFDMGQFFEKVILITHLSEVAERFPGRIRVEMDADGVSKAEVVA